MVRIARLAVAAVLIGLLAGMAVHYGPAADRHSDSPTPEQLATEYDSHVGESVYLWARVGSVGQGEFLASNYAVELTVRGTTAGLESGDYVQVYGTLEPGNVVDAERVVVSKQSRRPFLLGVSVLGAGVVLAGFVRAWRVDAGTLAFVPRDREPARGGDREDG